MRLNSYSAADGTNAEIVAKADPTKSDDEKLIIILTLQHLARN